MGKDSRLVWTSDPEEAKRLRERSGAASARDEDASNQTIHVAVDRKRRAGKSVTVANGFSLTPESLSRLATALKKKCGAGGTAKDGEIEIQGEHAETIANELRNIGYRVK